MSNLSPPLVGALPDSSAFKDGTMTDERRPLVYVPNQAGHDYTQADSFGEVVYITKGRIRKYDLQAFYEQASRVMSGSAPSDYILISSLNSICAVCSAIMAAKHGIINILLYRQDRYVEYSIQVRP